MEGNQLIWLALSTFLVLIMQAGFACFEAGLVRNKNSINVAIKNVADLGTSVVLFMLIGYPLMFGLNEGFLNGWVGWGSSPLFSDDPVLMLTALFQAMFAGTAVTIVSGAVAERTRFWGYLTLAAVIPVTIYPIAGHWAWGSEGWLLGLGFRDVAGGAVVHVVGGAIALAAVLVIGPRLGRFDSDGGIEPSNLAVAALGAFLLMFGWFGFNSGGSNSIDREVPLILVNTALAGSVGIVVGLALHLFRGTKPIAQDLFTAMLGGLVGVTAGCAFLSPVGAVLVGGFCASVALVGTRVLDRLEIDDPVSAIPVHLFGGLFGTTLYPLFAYPQTIPDGLSGRVEWVGIQLFGTVAIGCFAFASAFIFMHLIKGLVRFRVTPEEERVGLNVAEHNAHSGLIELLDQMANQGQTGDFSMPLKAEPETDAAYVALFYNGVRERFVAEAAQSSKLLEESNYLANHDTLTGLSNRRAFKDRSTARLSELARYGGESSLILLDIDHFKHINDTYGHDVGDEVLVEVAKRLQDIARESDLVARVGGEEITVLLTHGDETVAAEVAERLRHGLAGLPFRTSAGPLKVTASFGIAPFDASLDVEATLKACDLALYQAKTSGRNQVATAYPTPREVAGDTGAS
ncbi:MAG: ammonium transporter [Wenzhouxiangella sp.]|jgi:Amt family ammonium transporter|nr:ammonium transporter [Wenzhouxiangella sp.]